MRSRGEKWKLEWDFFINPKTGKIQYNKTCSGCVHDCRQSYKCDLVCCPDYEKAEQVQEATKI